MKTKGIVICMLIALTAAGVSSAQEEEQTAEKLKEIDEYIAQHRRQIEDHYAGRLVELQAKIEAQISLLEVADKGIYSPLIQQTKIAQTVLQINGLEDTPYGFFEPHESIDEQLSFHLPETAKKAPRLFAIAQSRIAEAKSDIMADYEWLTLDIEKQQRYALTVRLPELEETLKNKALSPRYEPVYGMITGIIHSKQPSTIINGKVVHENDEIANVRIVRIYPDRVKLEKKGKSWEQKVQEHPKKYWQ